MNEFVKKELMICALAVCVLAASCAVKEQGARLFARPGPRHFIFEQAIRAKFEVGGASSDYMIKTLIGYSEERSPTSPEGGRFTVRRDLTYVTPPTGGKTTFDSKLFRGESGGKSPKRLALINRTFEVVPDASKRCLELKTPSSGADGSVHYVLPLVNLHHLMMHEWLYRSESGSAEKRRLPADTVYFFKPGPALALSEVKKGTAKNFTLKPDDQLDLKNRPLSMLLEKTLVGLDAEGEVEVSKFGLMASFDRKEGAVKEAELRLTTGSFAVKKSDPNAGSISMDVLVRITEVADIDGAFASWQSDAEGKGKD
jgi:hypothetical protein